MFQHVWANIENFQFRWVDKYLKWIFGHGCGQENNFGFKNNGPIKFVYVLRNENLRFLRIFEIFNLVQWYDLQREEKLSFWPCHFSAACHHCVHTRWNQGQIHSRITVDKLDLLLNNVVHPKLGFDNYNHLGLKLETNLILYFARWVQSMVPTSKRFNCKDC